jgi:oxidase EvaA
MKGWYMDADGCIRHETGRFFSIEGIHVSTDVGFVAEWEQPIINQPEIGYLGILTKEIDGTLYFLIQAKIEPGNVNCEQISPTLQATKSNYTQQHRGRKPLYLEYFQKAKPHQVLLDQLQSEQGARFLRKRNRNIIIKVDEEVPVYDDFAWMTLAQIKELMHHDNMVNMDTRTVLAGLDFGPYEIDEDAMKQLSPFGRDMIASARSHKTLHTMNEHLSWLTQLKSSAELNVRYMPLKDVREWEGGVKSKNIRRKDGKFFQVIGTRVNISNREVASWCQPLVQPMQQGICAFIIRKIDSVYHFLVHAKMECGNLDIYELAPTVQCLTGNLHETPKEQWPAFADFVLEAKPEQILYDTLQSEEGGRFYHEQNRNMLIEVGDEFPIDVPADYHWMTLGQIHEFMRFNNYINIQARSLIAAIKYT